MLNVGVVGLGVMGNHHVRVYQELNCNLISLCDIAPTVIDIQNIDYFKDFKSMDRLDAVSIVTPTLTHREIAQYFLEQGVHCLVEKPISNNIEDAQYLIDCANQNNVKLMVGHIENFNPAVTRLKEMLDKGVIGDIMYITTRRLGTYVTRILDIGILLDSGSHDIGVSLLIAEKDPIDVYSKNWSIRNERGDYAVAILDFGTMAASIEVNWFTPHPIRTLGITGTKGTAWLDYKDQTVTIFNCDGELNLKIKKQEPLKIELQHFLSCIENDTTPFVDGYEGLRILKVALMAGAK
jgi:UDP-N-acetylglucosamine 3-dehydrogenase